MIWFMFSVMFMVYMFLITSFDKSYNYQNIEFDTCK